MTEITSAIGKNAEFGAVDLLLPEDALGRAGFAFGDGFRVTFSNGYRFENVPYYDGYYGKTGEVEIVAYPGEHCVRIARCDGDPLWDELSCRAGDTVTLERISKGAFLAVQKALGLRHSDDPADFASPEIFANFRALRGGNLKPNLIYRGASHVNNLYGRVATVNRLLTAHGIRCVLDLVALKVNCAYRSKPFKERVVEALRRMMASEGPYYVTCMEGKMRTGFVCLLLMCVAGATYGELETEYMLSWRNYFGVSREATPETYRTLLNVRFLDGLLWLCGAEDVAALATADFKAAARAYLRDGGLTDAEFRALVRFLTAERVSLP